MPAIVAELQRVAPDVKLRPIPYGNDLLETRIVPGTTALVLSELKLRSKWLGTCAGGTIRLVAGLGR